MSIEENKTEVISESNNKTELNFKDTSFIKLYNDQEHKGLITPSELIPATKDDIILYKKKYGNISFVHKQIFLETDSKLLMYEQEIGKKYEELKEIFLEQEKKEI